MEYHPISTPLEQTWAPFGDVWADLPAAPEMLTIKKEPGADLQRFPPASCVDVDGDSTSSAASESETPEWEELSSEDMLTDVENEQRADKGAEGAAQPFEFEGATEDQTAPWCATSIFLTVLALVYFEFLTDSSLLCCAQQGPGRLDRAQGRRLLRRRTD